MLFVKVDRPGGRSPDAHQDRSRRWLEQMVEQALVPVLSANESAPDQGYVFDRLDPYDSDRNASECATFRTPRTSWTAQVSLVELPGKFSKPMSEPAVSRSCELAG